jgi:hypothetical protein
VEIKFKSKSHTSEPPDESNKRHWNARFSWYHDADRVGGRSKSLASVLRTKSTSKFPYHCKEQKNSISFVITASKVVEKDRLLLLLLLLLLCICVSLLAYSVYIWWKPDSNLSNYNRMWACLSVKAITLHKINTGAWNFESSFTMIMSCATPNINKTGNICIT